MAKLSAAYILCPLIDQRSLLGVSEDSELDSVLVTVGRNIVIRYKLLDQKQISSWSSKDKFSCAVVYDKTSVQYVAVLNNTLMRMWSADQGNQGLDQVKKLRFERKIKCILPSNGGESCLVVFQDGAVCSLEEALSKRKTLSIEPTMEINNCQLIMHNDKEYLIFLSTEETSRFLHITSVDKEDQYKKKILLKEGDHELRGHTVLDSCLYTLWSDGNLYSQSLFGDDSTLIQEMSCLSSSHAIAMTALGKSHIAMYGAQDEGALLLIFNIQFKVIQAKQKSKLYGIAPRLWSINNNLFVASGNFLTVVPYHLNVAKLEALVGLHQTEHKKMARAVWGTNVHQEVKSILPKSIESTYSEQVKLGWTQSTISKHILPDVLLKQDVCSMQWCLENMTDISDECLVKILQFCLNEPDDDKNSCLNVLLNTPLNAVTLLPHLRQLSFSNTLQLLVHLANRLETNNAIEWLNLLLDSHYQQYLLSKDDVVLTIVRSIQLIINQQISQMSQLQSMTRLLHRLAVGKSIVQNSHFGSNNYKIEVIRLTL